MSTDKPNEDDFCLDSFEDLVKTIENIPDSDELKKYWVYLLERIRALSEKDRELFFKNKPIED